MTAPEEPFKLAQDVARQSLSAASGSAICGNCSHYEPHCDPKTGRVHPSKQGRCGWKPNIKWAMAYRRNGYGWREQDPMVYPVGVWKHTDAKTCACFSPNAEVSEAAAQDAASSTGGRTYLGNDLEEWCDIRVRKDLIPKGANLVEAYLTEKEIVVMGHPKEDDESHNCDAMGCGTLSHVLYRLPLPNDKVSDGRRE